MRAMRRVVALVARGELTQPWSPRVRVVLWGEGQGTAGHPPDSPAGVLRGCGGRGGYTRGQRAPALNCCMGSVAGQVPMRDGQWSRGRAGALGSGPGDPCVCVCVCVCVRVCVSTREARVAACAGSG